MPPDPPEKKAAAAAPKKPTNETLAKKCEAALRVQKHGAANRAELQEARATIVAVLEAFPALVKKAKSS